jgi:hypothetical protein
MTTLPIIIEGTVYTATVSVKTKTGLAVPLPGTIEATFRKTGDPTAFITATLANTKIASVDAVNGIIVFALPAGDLATSGDTYGTVQIKRTDTNVVHVIYDVRFIKQGQSLPSDYNGAVTIVGNAYVVTVESKVSPAIPPGSIDPTYLTPSLAGHFTDTGNPHNTTKTQVGLGSADNTSDASKPVSTAQAAALATKANTSHSHALTDIPTLTTDFRKGILAASMVPPAMLGAKALVLDFVNGGYASIDGAGISGFGAIENYPSATLTNSTGGLAVNRKKAIFSVAPNAPRYHHMPDGTPAGVLIEPSFSYLNARTQSTRAQLAIYGETVSDAATPAGETGSWLSFGVATSSVTYGYPGQISIINGTQYWISIEVIMDDGNAPVYGAGVTSGDFATYIAGNPFPSNPDTGLAGWKIDGPFQGNKYIVSTFATASVTGFQYYGILKYIGQSSRAFKTGRICVGQGRYPPSLFDNATSTPNARAGDILHFPVSQFTVDEITLFGQYVVPTDLASSQREIFNLSLDTNNQVRLIHNLSNQPYVNAIFAGVTKFDGPISANVIGQSYRFAYSLSLTNKLVKVKTTGNTLQALSMLGPTSPFVAVKLSVGSYLNGLNQINSPIALMGIVDRAWTAAEITQWVG